MKGSDFLKEHKELIGLLGNTSKALRKEALAQTNELTQTLMKNPTRKNALALAKRGSANLGKRMTTRGNRLVMRKGNVMGSGFILDELAHGAWDLGKKAKELHNKNEADRAVKAEAFNKRMAEIDKNNPFPKNPEMEKLLGYGLFDDFSAVGSKISNWSNEEEAKREAREKEKEAKEKARKDAFNQRVKLPLLTGGNGIFGDVFEDLAVDGAKKLYKFDKEHGSHLKSGLIGGLKNMVGSVFKGGNGVDYRTALSYGRGKKGMMRMPNGSLMRNSGNMGMGVLEDLAKNFKQPENHFAVLPDVYEPSPSNPFNDWVEKERRDTGYYKNREARIF